MYFLIPLLFSFVVLWHETFVQMIKMFKTCCCILLLFFTSQSPPQNKSQADMPIAHTKVCECSWKRAFGCKYLVLFPLRSSSDEKPQTETLVDWETDKRSLSLEKERHMLQRMKKWFSLFLQMKKNGVCFPQALSRSESHIGQRPHPGDTGWYRQNKTLSEYSQFTSALMYRPVVHQRH